MQVNTQLHSSHLLTGLQLTTITHTQEPIRTQQHTHTKTNQNNKDTDIGRQLLSSLKVNSVSKQGHKDNIQ